MSDKSRWRQRSREAILAVEREHPDATIEDLDRLISKAYPFGERENLPYRIWLEEVRAARESRKRRRRWAELARKVG